MILGQLRMGARHTIYAPLFIVVRQKRVQLEMNLTNYYCGQAKWCKLLWFKGKKGANWSKVDGA